MALQESLRYVFPAPETELREVATSFYSQLSRQAQEHGPHVSGTYKYLFLDGWMDEQIERKLKTKRYWTKDRKEKN